MPELPEVERARRLVHDNLLNKKIVRVDTTVDDIVYNGCSNTEFAEKLKGQTVKDTGRKGKVFWFIFDKVPNAVLHLGMTGSVRIKGQPGLHYEDFSTSSSTWPPKFHKFVLVFSTGEELAFTDPRRLARIRLVDGDPHDFPPVSELGFDPYLEMPALDVFSGLVKGRKVPVKALILNQSFSAGVGNWVADEILYQARIHPAQYTNTLTEAEIAALYEQMAFVVKTAVEVNADSSRFPDNWIFKHRWGKGATKAREATLPDGSIVRFETVGGRTSAIVPAVQKVHGDAGAGGRKSKSKVEKSEPASPDSSAPVKPSRTKKRKPTREDADDDPSPNSPPPIKSRTTKKRKAKSEDAQADPPSDSAADDGNEEEDGPKLRRSKRKLSIKVEPVDDAEPAKKDATSRGRIRKVEGVKEEGPAAKSRRAKSEKEVVAAEVGSSARGTRARRKG
ncbi:DNA glycosylase/AP lyase [Fimicolochytrium jonesii]|uniref:DNA glycosylase/AP lyase n=1 Tax=Fimicolochytrium jonesii TaxID=1396493 RepID=UPI0022FEEC0E|nr:DNA glycosylase/AP lyase [Fimicolochytrium jonesii]KAI8824523.1 DNA glycosylase/AP lyase [Fimicolochytrium jonesii]